MITGLKYYNFQSTFNPWQNIFQSEGEIKAYPDKQNTFRKGNTKDSSSGRSDPKGNLEMKKGMKSNGYVKYVSKSNKYYHPKQ